MSCGAMCYSLWIASFILPTISNENSSYEFNKDFIEYVVIITAGINGAGAAILWVSQGKYISECANDSNKGFFNIYFWGFYMSSTIFGNVIAALVLHYGGSKTTLFILFAILAVLGALLFCLLSKPVKTEIKEDPLLNKSEDKPI